jgi:hypothetical protein
MVGRPRRPNQRRNRLAVVTSGRQPGATAHGVAGRWCSCNSSTVVLLESCSWLHGDIGHLFLFQSNDGYIRFHICTFTTINRSNAHATYNSNVAFHHGRIEYNPMNTEKTGSVTFNARTADSLLIVTPRR